MKVIVVRAIGEEPSIVATYVVHTEETKPLIDAAQKALDEMALQGLTKRSYRVSSHGACGLEYSSGQGAAALFAACVEDIVKAFEARPKRVSCTEVK